MSASLLLAFLGAATFALTAAALARPRRNARVVEAPALWLLHAEGAQTKRAQAGAARRNRPQRPSIPAARAAA